ncbi:MAG TPA: hypothetical protein VFG54_13775 [Prolixibacteraceae bacterium]|nr:hypothetical protein [Prolixibacteraceae bacterium]
MRVLILLLICISSLSLYSQSIEVFGGANRNLFYGKKDANYSYFTANYQAGDGFTAGIGIDSLHINRFRMRFALQFDQYNGGFNAESNSGKAVYQRAMGEIVKSVVSLGFFPLNFTIKKKLDLNFGAEVSSLLNENVSGTGFYESLVEGEPVTYGLSDHYDRYSTRATYGLKSRMAYSLALSKILLIPQYSFYYGLSSEFREFPEAAKSMRHSLCIGIKMK